jgi:hypothetical protein
MAHMVKFYDVVMDIVTTLFEPDKRRLAAWVDRLIERNDEIIGFANHAFIYNGQQFRQSNVKGVIKVFPSLDYSLWDEADQFIADSKAIDQDKSFVRQALVRLMAPCLNAQDIRNALPECLADCIPALREYDRTAPEFYTIANNPRAQRQIAKIMPKLELYSVTRMMF